MRGVRALVSLARRSRGRSGYATTPPLSVKTGPWNYGDQAYRSIEDHFQRRPLLDVVPQGRLILPDTKYPYQILKHTDRIIQSGFNIVNQSNNLGVSTEELWTKDNVHIFAQLGSFALKDVDLSEVHSLTPAQKKGSFVAYFNFVKSLISEAHGDDALNMLPVDLDDIEILISKLDQDENLAELIVHNPTFLQPLPKAIMYLSCYNMLIKGIPLLTQNGLPVPGFVPTKTHPTAASLLVDLLKGLPYTSGDTVNDPWGTVVAQLNYPVFSVWSTATAMSKDDAQGLLAMLRCGVSHPCEEKMIKAILLAMANAAATTTLHKMPPTLDEVILFFDYYLPRVAPALALQFYRFGVYRWLKMRELFPLPSVDST